MTQSDLFGRHCAPRPRSDTMSASAPTKKKFKRNCRPGTCDNCGTNSTPNWRRGWPLAEGGYANLCNACGIRYKPGKGRKGGGDGPRPPVVPPPKQGPTKGMWTTPVKALTPAAGLPETLPSEGARGGARGRSGAARPSSRARKPRRRARSSSSEEESEPSSEEEEEEEDEEDGGEASEEEEEEELPLFARQRQALAPPDELPAAPAPRKRTGGARKPVQHITYDPDRPRTPPQRFAGFFTSRNVALDPDKHVMYFVRYADGSASLAAVGVDVFGSGHFRYTAAPTFRAPALTGCTRREELVAWLASMGAGTDLGEDDGTAAAAAAGAPAEPAAGEPGVWTSWREENKLAGGRRVRSFYLLDAAGHKTLAVEGLEGGGRHFAYETMLPRPSEGGAGGDGGGGAAAEPPGAKLPGRAEVMDFLRACIRASGGPLDAGGGEGGEGGSGASPRKRAAAAALLPAAPALSGDAGATFAAAMGAANATDSGVRKRQAPERFDPRPVRRVPSSGGGMDAAAAPDFTRFAAAAAAGAGAGGGPAAGYHLFGPASGVHPHSQLHHPSPYPQRGMDPLSIRRTPPPMLMPLPMPLPMPPRSLPAHSGLMGVLPARGASGVGYGAVLPAPPSRSYSAYTPPARVDAADLAAKVGPTASRWALETPTVEQVQRFKAWAAELDRGLACASDAAAPTATLPGPPQALLDGAAPPPPPPPGPDAPLTEARALEVLAALEDSEISLELLEASQIGRAVAMLRIQQASPAVAERAERIARSWRATADAIIAAVGSPPPLGGRTPA